MPFPTFTNDKSATGMNGDGLCFVLAAEPNPLWKKDKAHVDYHAPPAPSSVP